VDEGDVEAVAVVEERGELERWGDVTLRGEQEEHKVRLRRRRHVGLSVAAPIDASQSYQRVRLKRTGR
jgi:hypothetical protein